MPIIGGIATALAEGAGAIAPEAIAAGATDLAATAPLDLLAGGAAAGTADAAALGSTAALGGGLGTVGGAAGLGAGADLAGGGAAALGAGGLASGFAGDVVSGGDLSAFLSDPAAAAGGGLPTDVSALTQPAVTGASAGGSVAPGTGGIANIGAIDPSLTIGGNTLGSIDPSAPGWGQTLASTDLGGGTFPSVGAVPPSNAAASVAVPGDAPNVFGPAPNVFQTGTAATPFGAATGGAVPAGAAAAPGGPGLLSSIGSAVKDVAPAIGIGGLALTGYNAYQQNQQLKALQATETGYQNAIAQAGQAATAAAQPLLTSGEALTQYLQNGTLPAGLQKVVDQFKASAKAARIQAASNMGQSTDPKFNTALGQDLAAIDSQGDQLTVQFEQQLATSGNQMVQTATNLIQQGVSATKIAAQLPIEVQKLNIQLANETSKSIAEFASALNGRTPGIPGQGQITINTTTGAIA